MADKPGREKDIFGDAMQPKHRVDATTGGEGLERPGTEAGEEIRAQDEPAPDDTAEHVPGDPTKPRGGDAQE